MLVRIQSRALDDPPFVAGFFMAARTLPAVIIKTMPATPRNPDPPDSSLRPADPSGGDSGRESGGGGSSGRFMTTRWTMVVSAAGPQSPTSRQALEYLCRRYWFPLYAFIRRQGAGPQEAEDLTQGFLARLLEKRYLEQVDRSRGRFRTFLLTSLSHYLSNERDKTRAVKRGSGRPLVSFDAADAETRYLRQPVDTRSPEADFERKWAMTVLEIAIEKVRHQMLDAGRAELFESLKQCLSGQSDASTYAAIGRSLGMTEEAVKAAALRMRRKFRQAIREEIARTVEGPQNIDEEIKNLLNALSG